MPPVPMARGGQALPVVAKKKTVPKYTTPKLTPQTRPLTPHEETMGLFHSTLQQIRGLQRPVDTALIAAPYDTASVAAGQLGQGLAQATAASGQAAQEQYARARDEAQQHAAQFGITAGAGANPTALTDTGSSLIAQQTQAQSTAASQAAAAWQGLLERTKAQAIGKAQLDRSSQDYGLQMQLAGNIPTWEQNIGQQRFQEETARKNFALALGTAKDKRTNALRDYLLNVRQQGATESYQSGLLDVANRRATATEQANQERVAHWAQVETRLTKAARAKGLSSGDVSQILKTLKGPSASSQKTQQGYKVTVAAFDTQGMIPGSQTTYVAASPHATPGQGYQQVGVGVPNYVTTGGGSQKFSWSRYKAAANLARTRAAQQGVTLTDAEIRGMLGPTPKTSKKKG